VIVLLAYLHAAFGSFRPSYSYYDPNSFTFMQQRGYLGLTYPHIDVLLKLFFSCRRGFFFAAPVAIAGPIGLYLLWKREKSAAALCAAAIGAYYFLFNASFYEWRGGLGYGPRYSGACFPLLCVGLAVAWTRASAAWRRVLIVLGVASIASALMVVATSSQLSVVDGCPMFHIVVSAFWSGHVAVNHDTMLTAAEVGPGANYGAFNLGQLLGLHGLASLIPLLVAWGVAALCWSRLNKPARNASGV
jgi:hypothetical protein